MRAGKLFITPTTSDDEVIAATQAEYDVLLSAEGAVRRHFEAASVAFAKRPSSTHWRALKRAMLYLQAQSNTDRDLTPYFKTFRDEA